MKFKEINGIIDYLRAEGYEIVRHNIDAQYVIVWWGESFKFIDYTIHWETNGEYFYEIK